MDGGLDVALLNAALPDATPVDAAPPNGGAVGRKLAGSSVATGVGRGA